MAYVGNTGTDQEELGTGSAPMSQLPVTATGTGAGAVAANTSAAGSPQGAAAVPTTTSAPPVQDLQAYLTANAPQAAQMGQNIANNLENTATKVTGDINADQAAFDANVQANNTAPNSQLVEEAAANPTEFVQDPNNVAAFIAQEDAAYGGPASFEASPYYQSLDQEVQSAVSDTPNITTPAGIEQLVAGQETNPTLGMENLDQLLLEGTPGATAPIAPAVAEDQALTGTLGSTASTEDAAIQQAAADDAAAQTGVQSTFLTGPNAVVPTWESNLASELEAAQNADTAYNGVLSSGISTANPELQSLEELLNTDLSSLGPVLGTVENDIGNSAGAQPYLQAVENEYQQAVNPIEANLNDWLNATPQTTAPTEADVATSQDYATEQALQELLGSGLGVTPINQSTASEAGTYTVPSLPTASLDDSGLIQYLNDLTAMYSNPADNPFGQDNPNLTPAQQAQFALNGAGNAGQTNNAAYIAALNRLINGEAA